jgi:hypothetical protein
LDIKSKMVSGLDSLSCVCEPADLKRKNYIKLPKILVGPRPPAVLLLWRNGSLILVVLASLISLPRWQSIIGLIAALLFLYHSIPF